MQHWLKGISSAVDPFSDTFENLLRTNSGKQSGHRHVADIAQQQRNPGGLGASEQEQAQPSSDHKGDDLTPQMGSLDVSDAQQVSPNPVIEH